jgi:hypothetical protein
MNVPAEQLSPFPGDRREIISATAKGEPGHGEPGAARVPPGVLDGYLHEIELSKELNVIVRTLRKWRQTGEGPPYVKIGITVYYPIDGFRKWLAKRETTESVPPAKRRSRAVRGR